MPNKKPKINLLITDLDNTLFDWLSAQVPAFYAMVDVAAKILMIDQEQLLDELKMIHQQYHSSEQPFALLEIPAVIKKYPKTSRLERIHLLGKAINAFETVRKRNLQLFPSVRKTLVSIHSSGCPIVGYTEAVLDSSLYRLIFLNIIDLFKILYAPRNLGEGHPDPVQSHKFDSYLNKVFILPDIHRKPDPTVLIDICHKHEVQTVNTLYIGDHLIKDVAMAKKVGVHAIWAKYGTYYDPMEWKRLVRISHLTPDEQAQEKKIQMEYEDVCPDLEINSFSELLTHFEFGLKI